MSPHDDSFIEFGLCRHYPKWNLLYCVSFRYSTVCNGHCAMCKFFTSFFREECSSKGGTNDGSCASGFGVCCKRKSDINYQNRKPNRKFVAVEEACGSSKSENNTILGLLTNHIFCTYINFKYSSPSIRDHFSLPLYIHSLSMQLQHLSHSL